MLRLKIGIVFEHFEFRSHTRRFNQYCYIIFVIWEGTDMTKLAFGCFVLMISTFSAFGQSMRPVSPIVAEADGFAIIPNAAFPPDKKRIYRAVYDQIRKRSVHPGSRIE